MAAGGGAGIAATFNTPIGGVLFAAEILLHEISVRTLVPVALATATATYVSHFFFGDHPAFPIPPVHMPGATAVALLPAYVMLGGVMALASVGFIRGLYGAESLFDKYIPNRDYLRHIVGMLGVGIMAAALMRQTGHYHVEGVGYATIMDVLSGGLTSISLLLLLAVLKLAATSLTLGSGASGGIFSPSLFMGTALGAAYGTGLQTLFPQWRFDPAALALAGMAGMVAGATGAALTAIVMIFEMTLNYTVVLPMTLTVAVSYGLRRLVQPESIYTMKLARRGHYMPRGLQANATLVHHLSDIELTPVTVLPAGAPLERLATEAERSPAQYAVLLEGDGVAGVLSREWVSCHGAELMAVQTVAEAAVVAGERYVTVTCDTTIFTLLERLKATDAAGAVVLGPADEQRGAPRVMGLATLAHVAEVLAGGMEMFAD